MKAIFGILILVCLFYSSLVCAETQVFDVVVSPTDDIVGNPHNSFSYIRWNKEPDAGAFNGNFVWANENTSAFHLWGAGTGLGIRVIQQSNTKQIGWRIDGGDGGAGTIDTNMDTGNTPGVRYATYVLAATGTLAAGFHILEVTTNNSLSAGETIALDALEVYGAVDTTLHDQMNWYYIGGSGVWAPYDSGAEANNYATGGSVAYTLGVGVTCSFQFAGTGILLVISARWDCDAAINWSIDDGVSSGTILGPLALDGGSTNFRFPIVIANNLTEGVHTLTLSNGGGGANPDWSLIILDALEVMGEVPPTTRYEIGKDAVNNKVGFVHWNKWPSESNAYASGGEQVYAFDATQEGASQSVTFLFCGTGVDLGFWRYGNGEYIGWNVDDGAFTGEYDSWWWLAGNPGVGDRLSTPMTGHTSLSLASGFHKATVTNLDKSAAQIIVLDYFDVYNDDWDAVTMYENTDGSITYTGTWNSADPDGACSGGSRATTGDPAATMSLTFQGTSVAVIGWKQDICTSYNWTIDNGAGGSGTVDQYDAFDTNVRTIDFIVNGLSSGSHTLTISHGGGTGYIEIDYIAVRGGGATGIDDWTLY